MARRPGALGMAKLGSRGRKLHVKQLHIRKTHNKAFIARHIMTDHAGNPPSDGQDAEREYSLPDMQALLDHVQKHMGDGEQDVGDEESS